MRPSCHTPTGVAGMVNVTCVAVITGLTCPVTAEAISAVLSTVPTTKTVASDNANRRMSTSPTEGG